MRNSKLTTKELLKTYHSQPEDIDTLGVKSNFRVQREWHREKLTNVISNINLKGKKILDLACESGGLTRNLKRLVPSSEIFGLDFNDKAIAWAKKKDKGISGLHYYAGDAQKIPFKDSFFDIVVGLDMLDHIPNPMKCLSEINRVLKKGGEIAIKVENNQSLWPLVEFI